MMCYMISPCSISDDVFNAIGASSAGDIGAVATQFSGLWRREHQHLHYQHTTPRDTESGTPGTTSRNTELGTPGHYGNYLGSNGSSHTFHNERGKSLCYTPSGLRLRLGPMWKYLLSGSSLGFQLSTTNDKPRRNLPTWRIVHRHSTRHIRRLNLCRYEGRRHLVDTIMFHHQLFEQGRIQPAVLGRGGGNQLELTEPTKSLAVSHSSLIVLGCVCVWGGMARLAPLDPPLYSRVATAWNGRLCQITWPG